MSRWCSNWPAFHPSADIRYEAEGDLQGEWDADRLAQLVSNLVGNALEHGGEQLVTVVARGAEDAVLIRVHNDGRPIPEDVQPSIFEPLVRHVSGDTELPTSVGVGLFIARGIAVSHGGTIRDPRLVHRHRGHDVRGAAASAG